MNRDNIPNNIDAIGQLIEVGDMVSIGGGYYPPQILKVEKINTKQLRLSKSNYPSEYEHISPNYAYASNVINVTKVLAANEQNTNSIPY